MAAAAATLKTASMLIVLSPAKALDFTAPPVSAPLTTPQMTDQTAELSKITRKLTARDLARLMSLSDSLAKLIEDHGQSLQEEFRKELGSLEQEFRRLEQEMRTGFDRVEAATARNTTAHEPRATG